MRPKLRALEPQTTIPRYYKFTVLEGKKFCIQKADIRVLKLDVRIGKVKIS